MQNLINTVGMETVRKTFAVFTILMFTVLPMGTSLVPVALAHTVGETLSFAANPISLTEMELSWTSTSDVSPSTDQHDLNLWYCEGAGCTSGEMTEIYDYSGHAFTTDNTGLSSGTIFSGTYIQAGLNSGFTYGFKIREKHGGALTEEIVADIIFTPPQCDDNVDNDLDGDIDYPDDAGCANASDDDESDDPEPPENTKPVINLNGSNPTDITVGGAYTEDGATADDAEDGDGFTVTDITGAVNTLVIGIYQIFYNFFDSEGLDADEVIRTVNVNPGDTECSDGVNNDGDADVDLDDEGCDDLDDDSENIPPVITLTGSDTVDITVGGAYTEDGATADDNEDGTGLTVTDIDSSEVDTDTVGTYTVYYNFVDSDGAAAPEVTRTVNVNPEITECNDGEDNDGDGEVDLDDSGCSSPGDNSENTPPEITVDIEIVTLTLGGSSPVLLNGVTADDVEDGDISGDIATGGDAVDMNNVGDYVVTYDVADSDGADADQQTRTYQVRTECADGIDNEDDGFTDDEDPACHTDGDVDNSESYDSSLNDESNDPAEEVLGCTDPEALNFNPEATEDDESCEYEQSSPPPPPSPPPAPVSQPECNDGIDNDGDTLIDYPEPGCDSPEDDSELGSGGGGGGSNGPPGSGPIAPTVPSQSGGTVLGVSTGPAGEVLGEELCSEILLTDYLKQGQANNPEQVTKLQNFLNGYMNAGLPLSGFFGSLTHAAVKAFQVREANNVLDPWLAATGSINEEGTGYVYKTTRRWINLLHCADLEIPLPQLP